MEESPRSPARIFAPIALVVFGIAVLIVLASAGGSDDSSSKDDKATKAEQRDLRVKKRRARARERRASRSVYVVRAGDTLGGIAETTGVSVERLQELNPDVDPQALTSGQRLKLK
ncbi:MAG TPA: LysM domain-containing protein [Thermoleophilaceae bacterium]|nr:LysM domain-containing protein [Thermoleophilaceae bacterium]